MESQVRCVENKDVCIRNAADLRSRLLVLEGLDGNGLDRHNGFVDTCGDGTEERKRNVGTDGHRQLMSNKENREEEKTRQKERKRRKLGEEKKTTTLSIRRWGWKGKEGQARHNYLTAIYDHGRR